MGETLRRRTTKKFLSNDSLESIAPFVRTRTLILVFLLVAAVWNMKRYQGVLLVPREDTPAAPSTTAIQTSSQSSSWSSPHLLDCREMQNDVDDVSKGNLFVTTTTEPSFQMSIHNPVEDVVSGMIRNNGCWECRYIREMVQVLSLYQDSYLLDIGGNIGMWSLAAAAANKETFTIEPSRQNFERICATVNKNSFHDQVNLLTMAATKEETVFKLIEPEGNKGGTMVVEEKNPGTNPDANVINGAPIDSLNLPTKRPVAIKIDVEGHELMAVLGAMGFLEEANIVYVMIELRSPQIQSASRKEWSEIFKFFSSKGLVPFRKDYAGKETKLDPNNLSEWKHHKHPAVKYFDVVWKKKKV